MPTRLWLTALLLAAGCGSGSEFRFSFVGLWQGELDLVADDCAVETGNLSESHQVMQSGSQITLVVGGSSYAGTVEDLAFNAASAFPACCVDAAGNQFGRTTRYETYDYRRVDPMTADVTLTQEFRGGCHPGCRRVWEGSFHR